MYLDSCTAVALPVGMKEKDDTKGGSIVPHGVTLTYSCADRYNKIKGNGVITCNTGILPVITLVCARKLYKRHVDLNVLNIIYSQFIVLIICVRSTNTGVSNCVVLYFVSSRALI